MSSSGAAAATAADAVHQFGNISVGGSAAYSVGTLKMSSAGFGFKARSGASESVSAKLIKSPAYFVPIARGFSLVLQQHGGTRTAFDGFRPQDAEFLANFLQEKFNVALEQVPVSTQGWNWGNAVLDEDKQEIRMVIGDAQAFAVPLTEISNASCKPKGLKAQKDDAVLEFHQYDTSAAVDSLVEMRIYVPNEAGPDEPSSALVMAEKIAEQAESAGGGGAVAGTGLLSLSAVPTLTPRGRFEVEFFPTFVRMSTDSGATSREYKVLYKSITRMFLLPKPDGKHSFFVLSLDPPIRQGATTYPHVVMQLSGDDEVSASVTASPDQLTKFQGLETTLEGSVVKVVAQAFSAFLQKKPVAPSGFQAAKVAYQVTTDVVNDEGEVVKQVSHDVMSSAVRCSYKSSDGFLYPLAKSFVFVYKPPVYIRFDEIAAVEFGRRDELSGTAAARHFDLMINLLDGHTYTFANVPREDFKPLFSFCEEKDIRIINIEDTRKTDADITSELKDAEMAARSKKMTSDDPEAEPGSKRKRGAAVAAAEATKREMVADAAEGPSKSLKKLGGDSSSSSNSSDDDSDDSDDDDDESSSDGDFMADSDSDVAEEYDSQFEGDSDEDVEGPPPSPSRDEKKSKKSKKDKSSKKSKKSRDRD